MDHNGIQPVQGTPVAQWVQKFLQQLTALWWESDTSTPPLGPTFTMREQKAREAHLARFLDTLVAELKHPPRTVAERQATQERIFSAFGAFARAALDWEERHLDVLLQRGFPQVGTGFPQMARRFDATVGGADVFQASRNAWTMSGLQLLLGLPVQLTPAMFAYSMLYPYTDNYLDDPKVLEPTKVSFNERFGQRLLGGAIAPCNAHERAIFDLVGIIESQYERAKYPQVYDSLMAIHRAQIKSVWLLRGNASPYEVDVLGISLEKGGASVLADGYLAAGSLSEAQAEFMFGFGAFLQLADDLQDVEGDSKAGLLTVFSQTAGRWPLDAITNRTFHFGRKVLERLDCFDAPAAEPLKELMRHSMVMLVSNAAGAAGRFHSRPYLQKLEAHSPFRFSTLRQNRQRLARERVSLLKLIEAFAVA